MKKNLFIILILLPNLCLALSKEEINAIAEIVNCSDKITSEEKLKCFEENASNLESIFPIARLEKTERVKEIEKIERLEKEGNFGILQTVNPIKGFENKDLNSISSKIINNYWLSYGKIKIELENGQTWKQIDSTPYRGPKDLKGKQVRITSAALGSFLLKIDGVGGKYRVRREQ